VADLFKTFGWHEDAVHLGVTIDDRTACGATRAVIYRCARETTGDPEVGLELLAHFCRRKTDSHGEHDVTYAVRLHLYERLQASGVEENTNLTFNHDDLSLWQQSANQISDVFMPYSPSCVNRKSRKADIRTNVVL
jgi:hypothetical protein